MCREKNSQTELHRREFLRSVGVLGTGSILGRQMYSEALRTTGFPKSSESAAIALNGGNPVRKTPLRAAHYGPQFFDDEERTELLEVLDSKSPFRWRGFRETQPKKVLQFEKEFAQYMGVAHAVGVTSGTTALITALAALGIGPGDEVILPAWTWYSCYDAVVFHGALPVFAEIDASFNIDPEDVESRITPRTKVLMTVHLQGCPCNMEALLAIARRHELKVLEDCAQCVGGQFKGKFVGSMGDIGIYSFQVNKTITAGEGGAVVTSDDRLFERALRFHDVGRVRPPYQQQLGADYASPYSSANFRMSEFTGAVLRAQLRKLDTICERLRANSKEVRNDIAGLRDIKFRKSPDQEGDLGVGVYVDLETRERQELFRKAMEAENVPASPPSGSVILPIEQYIINKQTVQRDWPSFQSRAGQSIRYGAASCPRTIDILRRHAGVPIDPNFKRNDLKDIGQAMRKVLGSIS